MANVDINQIEDGGDGKSFSATGTHVRSKAHYLHAALVPKADPTTEIPYSNIAYAITNKKDVDDHTLWHLFFEAIDPIPAGQYWFRIFTKEKPKKDHNPEAEAEIEAG